MALTITKVRDSFDIWGKSQTAVFDITLDTSYPLTNGYPIAAGDVGLRSIVSARVEGSNKAGGAVLPVLDFGAIGTSPGLANTSVILRLFHPSGGATAPATLTAPVAGGAAGGAITIGGTATATPAGGATPVTSTGAQPAIPVDLTNVTATPAAGAAAALTAGIGKEVGNTTNVSALTYRVRFIGN